MPGDYLAGVVVQDLDGGLTRRYAPVTPVGDWRCDSARSRLGADRRRRLAAESRPAL